MTYSGAGVDTDRAGRELRGLAKVLAQTAAFRPDVGRSVLEHGYYASALRLDDKLALGICTDGVGSKILVAERMGRFDTIGIDCIAMNVNDLVCIGAEPIGMVDYVGVEQLQPGVLEQVARGLLEGARQARITIPGGETAQLPGMIRGERPGSGLDLVGTAVGLAPMERLNCGEKVAPGDVVIGLRSSGLHSNGYSLARRALFEGAGYDVDTYREELQRTVGEELLEPTRIYVRGVMALFEADIPLKAVCHITGDGLLNLNRVAVRVGWELDTLPEPQPIFKLIEQAGSIAPAEMFTVFNMGIGLCIVAATREVDRICDLLRAESPESAPQVIGRVVEDPDRRVRLPQFGLKGSGTAFA